MKKTYFSTMIILSFLLFQACNNNGKRSSKQVADSINQTNNQVSKTASDFLVNVSIGEMMEIKAGEIARQKSDNSRVKNFGKMMITDHKRINNKLKVLADQKHIVLPDSLDQNHQAEMEELESKKGLDFNRDYMNMMVKEHEKDVKDFEMAGRIIVNTDINDFITQTLAILQIHLDSAKAIQVLFSRDYGSVSGGQSR